jgi:hypothetical protein
MFYKEPILCRISLVLLASWMTALVLFYFAYGTEIYGLKLAVVNDNECIENHQVFNNSFCLFIKKIVDENFAKFLPYESSDLAFKDAFNKKLFGIIIFPLNFTDIMNNWTVSEQSIHVYLDQTDYHKTWKVKSKLIKIFQNFAEELNLSEKIFPFNIETMFGSLGGDGRRDFFPTFVISYVHTK